MENKIRFGILGCGGISRRFAKALSQSDSAELVAVAARNLEGAEKFTSEYPAKAYGSYEELLNDKDVDAVYIGVVHTGHFPLAMECIKHQKPVLSEKPFLIKESEALALKKAANEAGVLAMEAMWTRFLPETMKVKEWIDTGRIGKVQHMQADFSFCFPYEGNHKTFRLWDPKVAGGAILDAGVYPYEYFTGLMGMYPEKVIGLMDIHETGVDQSVTMSLRFPNGVLANGVSSIVAQGSRLSYIGGTNGHITQDGFHVGGTATLFDNEGNVIEVFETSKEKDGFVYQIEHFSNLVREGKIESDLMPLSDSIDFARSAEMIFKQNGVEIQW